MEIPKGYKFTRTHEWVKLDGDVATIGITDYAQGELGDITYIELPGVGAELRQSEPFGVIESVKAASDIYAPLSGEVVEENPAAIEQPELVNASPFDDAWLLKVRLHEPDQVNSLLDAEEYGKLVADAGSH